MTIKRDTLVDQIEIGSSHISVRVSLNLTEGEEVLSSQYHRISFEVSDDCYRHMFGVNQHLELLGWPAVGNKEIERIGAFQKLSGE